MLLLLLLLLLLFLPIFDAPFSFFYNSQFFLFFFASATRFNLPRIASSLHSFTRDRPTIRLLQKLVPDEIDPPLPRRRQLIPRLNGRAAVAVVVLRSSLFLITQFSRRFNCRGRHRGDGKRASVAVLYSSRRLVVSF